MHNTTLILKCVHDGMVKYKYPALMHGKMIIFALHNYDSEHRFVAPLRFHGHGNTSILRISYLPLGNVKNEVPSHTGGSQTYVVEKAEPLPLMLPTETRGRGEVHPYISTHICNRGPIRQWPNTPIR
jgi:hypothetical protein